MSNNSNDFIVSTGAFSAENMIFNGEETKINIDGYYDLNNDSSLVFSNSIKINILSPFCEWYNYFGLTYTSDSYIKGTINYKTGVKEKSEEFFLEPSKTVNSFYSFTDNCLDNVKANAVYSISFEPLNTESAVMTIYGFSVFNREVPDSSIYVKRRPLDWAKPKKCITPSYMEATYEF